MLKQRTLRQDDHDEGRRPAYRRPRRCSRSIRRRSTPASCSGAPTSRRRSRFQRAPTTSAIRDCRRRSRPASASISTVEHLMSALCGLGVDNLRVDVAGPELPIMDGSAGPFVYLLQSAGIVEQAAAKKFIRITLGRRGARRRQVGALHAVRRFPARLHDRLPASAVRVGEQARRHRFRRALVYQGSGARAHVRVHAGRRGDARRGPGARAAACRTRSCWTRRAC